MLLDSKNNSKHFLNVRQNHFEHSFWHFLALFGFFIKQTQNFKKQIDFFSEVKSAGNWPFA